MSSLWADPDRISRGPDTLEQPGPSWTLKGLGLRSHESLLRDQTWLTREKGRWSEPPIVQKEQAKSQRGLVNGGQFRARTRDGLRSQALLRRKTARRV